jgi:hypothetical protein
MADEARSLKAYGELPESSACPWDAWRLRGCVQRERCARRLLGFWLARCSFGGSAAGRMPAAAAASRAQRDTARLARAALPLPARLARRSARKAPQILTESARAFCAAVRVNETDTFDEERGENDDFFDFDDVAEI